MSIILILIYLPYSLWILYYLANSIDSTYDWDVVHGSTWGIIIKLPSNGAVRTYVWPQIATGYLFFLLFGTGTDAYNTYKRMLCAVGLGRIFPSLLVPSESSTSTPSSVTFAKEFASSCATKAKGFFSWRDSVDEMNMQSACAESICLSTPSTHRSGHLTHVSTAELMLPRIAHKANQSTERRSIVDYIFGGRKSHVDELPVFSSRSFEQLPNTESPVKFTPTGFSARVWAAGELEDGRRGSADGVRVVREVCQTHRDDDTGKQRLNADIGV